MEKQNLVQFHTTRKQPGLEHTVHIHTQIDLILWMETQGEDWEDRKYLLELSLGVNTKITLQTGAA